MAKGDDSRVRNMISSENKAATENTNALRNQLQTSGNNFNNLFNNAATQQGNDYSNLMSGYKGFQDTGGFSPEDLSNIRARSISPIRAAYSNANRDINRRAAMQGGYSPGLGVLKARMAREQGQGAADASTNAEAGIAQLVQQGKLAGLGGASQLYGTSPGMARTYGDMFLNNQNQQLGLNEQDIKRGLGYTGQLNEAAKLPGKFQSIMGNINAGWNTAKNVGRGIAGAFGF